MTIPETGTVTDIFFSVAAENIANLQIRDGAEVAKSIFAECSPTRSEPERDTMQVEVGLDNTQVSEGYASLLCGRCRE